MSGPPAVEHVMVDTNVQGYVMTQRLVGLAGIAMVKEKSGACVMLKSVKVCINNMQILQTKI